MRGGRGDSGAGQVLAFARAGGGGVPAGGWGGRRGGGWSGRDRRSGWVDGGEVGGGAGAGEVGGADIVAYVGDGGVGRAVEKRARWKRRGLIDPPAAPNHGGR